MLCMLRHNWWGLNPTALRKAKTAYNFGLSECNRVKNNFKTTFFSSLQAEIVLKRYEPPNLDLQCLQNSIIIIFGT